MNEDISNFCFTAIIAKFFIRHEEYIKQLKMNKKHLKLSKKQKHKAEKLINNLR